MNITLHVYIMIHYFIRSNKPRNTSFEELLKIGCTLKDVSNYVCVLLLQFLVALTMDYALGGVNPSQMFLIGHLTQVPLHLQARDHRQVMVDQASHIRFYFSKMVTATLKNMLIKVCL